MRFRARIASLLGLLLLCVPPHLVARFLTGESRWPRRFLHGVGRICGLRVSVAGVPLRQDVFFVANHVSWLDILAVGGATGSAFVSRDDVGRWPVIGWLTAQNNTILVSRSARGSVHEQVGALRRALERHQPVTLFAEGTTGDGHHLLPFKPSLFAVLLPPPRAIRVQPVLIDYGVATDAVAWVGDEPAGDNVRGILSRRERIPVTLHFLDPVDPAAFPDRKALAAEAHRRIEAALHGIRQG